MFLCTCYGICGKGYHRSFFTQSPVLCFCQCLYAVHAGHHMIEEYKIIGSSFHSLQTFFARGCEFCRYAEYPEQILCHLAVHLVVIGDKYPFTAPARSFLLVPLPPDGIAEITHRSAVGYGLHDRKGKHRTLAVYARYTQLAVHHGKQLCHYGHTETRSLYAVIFLFVKAREGFKELFHILLLYADTRVLYLNEYPCVIPFSAVKPHRERDRSPFRVLHRIREQVHYDL